MDKRLVNSLLVIFHAKEDPKRVAAGSSLHKFHQTYNIGRHRGAALYFSKQDKQEIRHILAGELGIDAQLTSPSDWMGHGRDTSLALGRNEKFARAAVGEGRLQVKALLGHALSICGMDIDLPERCDLGIDVAAILRTPVAHLSILLVENRQTFLEIWRISHGLLDGITALNPLVVFRGDAGGGAQADAVNILIEGLPLPVYAFVDYDPAGMVIAAGLPRLDGLIAPEICRLRPLLMEHGLKDRFMAQIHTKHVLERLISHPLLGAYLAEINAAGKALPQEFFHQRVDTTQTEFSGKS